MLPAFLVYRHTRHFSLHPALHHYSLFAYRGWTRPVVPPNFPPKPNQRPPPSPHPVCKSCVKKTNFMWVCQLVSLAVCLCYLPNCFSPFLSHTNSPYCPSLSSAELCMSLSHTHTHTHGHCQYGLVGTPVCVTPTHFPSHSLYCTDICRHEPSYISLYSFRCVCRRHGRTLSFYQFCIRFYLKNLYGFSG